MNITASMVKELRERTGAGMMECKKALEAAQGDIEAAVVAMRKSGQAKAAKRAGRIAAEGVVLAAVDSTQKSAFIVEINCETDFVARSDQFKDFAQMVGQTGLEVCAKNVEQLLETPLASQNMETVEQVRQALVSKVGENIHIRRSALLEASGTIGAYVHSERIGVLVALDQDNVELARDIAMHIAAINPLSISPEDLAPELIQKEREIFAAQSASSGKPQHVIDKMIEGRIEKFLREVCLVNQAFVKNSEQTVGQLLKSHQAQVTAFVRYEVGEGIERQTHDLAAEVSSITGK